MKFTYHYDHPNQRWNVFELIGRHEVYVKWFKTLAEAQTFCDGKNGG